MHKSNNAVSIVIGPPESGNIDSNTKRNLDFLRDEAFSFEPGELEIDKKKMRMNLMVVKDCNKNILWEWTEMAKTADIKLKKLLPCWC